MMLKREVLQAWERRAIAAQTRIDEEIGPEMERLRYEAEIVRRLLSKAQDSTARQTWQTQADVLEMMLGMAEESLDEQREEMALSEAVIAEIEADLVTDQPGQEGAFDA